VQLVGFKQDYILSKPAFFAGEESAVGRPSSDSQRDKPASLDLDDGLVEDAE
jgi:hypothetical protein